MIGGLGQAVAATLIPLAVGGSAALDTAMVTAVPERATVTLGETIRVHVGVDESLPFRAYDVIVDFDETKLQTLRVSQGPMFSSRGYSLLFFAIETEQFVQVNAAILGQGDVPGPGTVFTIEFKAVGPGAAGLAITRADLRTSDRLSLPWKTVPASLRVVTGVAQMALIAPPQPAGPFDVAVLVRDNLNAPVSDIPVVFAVSSDVARVSPARAVTDARGIARTTIVTDRLGELVELDVRVDEPGGLAETFSVLADAPVEEMAIVGGDGQFTPPGRVFPSPLAVRVTDASGRGMAGVPVAFTLTEGVAMLDSTQVRTNAEGMAQTSVRAGSALGSVRVRAALPGREMFNVTFVATVAWPVAVEELAEATPGQFRVGANRPNPFNNETLIPVELEPGAEGVLVVYAATGAVLHRIPLLPAGPGMRWLRLIAASEGGNAWPSGVYIYQVASGPHVAARKMTLIK